MSGHDTDDPIVALEALQRERSLSAAVLDTVGALVVVLDVEGRIVRFNRACERLTLYSFEEVKGLKFSDLFLIPEEVESVQQVFHRLRAGDYPNTFENYWKRRDGARRLIAWSNTVLLGPAGEVELVIGTGMDITDRQRAEDALQEVNRSLRALIEAAPMAVIAVDREWKIKAWNPAAERIFGWRADEVIDRPSPLVREGDSAEDWAAREAALSGRAIAEFHTRRARSDGTILDVSLSAAPLRNQRGEIIGTMATFADVTERRRAEVERDRSLAGERCARAAAEAAEERAAFLADASTVLARTLDYDGTLDAVARLAVPYLADWSVVDLVDEGGAIRRVAVEHRDPAKAELARALQAHPPDLHAPGGVSAVIRTGKPLLHEDLQDPQSDLDAEAWPRAVGTRDREQLRLIRAMGLRTYLAVPLVARGRTLGAVTFASAGEARRYRGPEIALAEELARRAAVAIDNAALYREAQQAIQQREEFLSIASHELRTPLTSLHLALQTVLRAARRAPTAAMPAELLVGAFETAERQSKRLSHLVDTLLDLSRIHAGSFELDPAEMDLAVVARDVAASFREELARTSTTLALELAPAIGVWDRSRMEQVAANLISNAVKYGAGGPIELSVACDGNLARLTVSDQGIGIAPERQARIFERYERAVSPRHYGGLGLGLYIVRKIVTAHGGSVGVESVPGAGAIFTVELPRQPSRPAT